MVLEPGWKLKFIRRITDTFFTRQLDIHMDQKRGIFSKNNQLCNGYYEIIEYSGIRHKLHGGVKNWAPCIQLRPELSEEFSVIIKNINEVLSEQREVEEWFRQMCMYYGSDQHIIMHLPECICEYLPSKVHDRFPEWLKHFPCESVGSVEVIEILNKRKMINLLLQGAE